MRKFYIVISGHNQPFQAGYEIHWDGRHVGMGSFGKVCIYFYLTDANSHTGIRDLTPKKRVKNFHQNFIVIIDFSLFPLFKRGSAVKGKNLLPDCSFRSKFFLIRVNPYFGRVWRLMETNRNSQELPSFVKMRGKCGIYTFTVTESFRFITNTAGIFSAVCIFCRYKERLGVIVGPISILIKALPMTGRK